MEYALLIMLFQLDEHLLAQKDYAACLKIHPTNSTALFNLALLHFNERFECLYSVVFDSK